MPITEIAHTRDGRVEDFEHLDYYALLGVERNATADELKRAYRQQIIRYHPDRFATASAEEQEYARQRTLRINEAYSTLSDFASRSAYSRNSANQRTAVAAPPKPQPAPPPRDHQAELYNQARAHIDGGRYVQAIAILRQLQQVNPFYRDVAGLIAMVEAQMQPEAPARQTARPTAPAAPTTTTEESDEPGAWQRSRRWVLGGAAAIAALLAAVAGLRGQASRLTSGQSGEQAEITATAEPAVAVDATLEATVAPSATSIPASPTPIPASPTSEPTSEPTVASSATPAPPTPVAESGEVLLSDAFSQGGWPSLQGTGWSVGYAARGTYRIVASPNSGNIWSYRTLGVSNYSLGVDVLQADGGSAGLLVRYQDRTNYVVCMISPSEGTYRVEQRRAGRVLIIDQGTSDAIDILPGAINRVVARVEDNQLTMIVNGTPVVEAAVPSMPQTEQYGLVATAGSGPVDARFDNLEARTIPPAP